MTTVHVAVNVRIHQHAITLTSTIQILASAFASHMIVQHISISILKPVAVAVVRLKPAQGINSSTVRPVRANARESTTAPQGDTMTMIHVSVSVATFQRVMLHSSMIRICVGVSANPMTAMRISTSIRRAAVVNVLNTRPAQTINTSIGHPANANVVR